MPKKKNPRNGFYFYMQDVMQDLRREGRPLPNGMADVVPIAHPRWKLLPPDERERYENIAKQEKRKSQGKRPDSQRLDNVGNIISDRLDKDLEDDKRRRKEDKITKSRWPAGNEIIDVKFYFIAFEYMIETQDGEFRPMEIGMVEFSLKSGITKTFHKFIEPGPIPLGYRYQAQSHSDETHNIPIKDFELADNNYRGLWIQIENFINPSGSKKEYPPIYTQFSDMNSTMGCLDWIHAHSGLGRQNNIHHIFELENMVVRLYAQGGAIISIGGALELLSTSAFDYEPNTRCKWHEEKEVKYCALGTVKRFAYALSDSLADIFDFELLPNAHLPEQPDGPPGYMVLPPGSIHMDYAPIPNRKKPANTWGNKNDNSGPFASRDIRYKKAEEEPEEEEFEPNEAQIPETMRRPKIPGYTNPPVPWGTRTGQPSIVPENPAEWPTLGGAPEPNKPSGRGGPLPGNTAAARLSAWENQGKRESPPTVGRPFVEHVKEQSAPQRPTIHQAVAAQQMGTTQPMQVQQPAQASGTTPLPSWGPSQPTRRANARGPPPRFSAPRTSSQPTPNQPPILPQHPSRNTPPFESFPTQLNPGLGPRHPTAGPRNPQLPAWGPRGVAPPQPPSVISMTPSVLGDDETESWPGLVGPSAVSTQPPSAATSLAPSIVDDDADSWPGLGGASVKSEPPAGVRGEAGVRRGAGRGGFGRGRGLWNPAGRGVATAPKVRPPPGFGRGVSHDLASLSLSDTYGQD